MEFSKEIIYILRRVSISDIEIIFEKVLFDQNGCYYKKKYGEEKGYEMFYRAVIDEMSDVIFYRMADYNLLNSDESTEEEEINIINKGLNEMFSDTIKEYYDNLKCKGYEPILSEAKYNNNDAENFLFRRVSINELEDEFYKNYKYYSEGHSHPGNTFSSFKRRFLDYMMDGIHGRLLDGFMEDSNMYDAVMNLLEDMYEERIEDLWFEVTDDECLNENLNTSSKYLDKILQIVSLVKEDKEPDFEWDFTDIKKNIDKSTSWIKTKEEAKKYLELLKKKIKNLDDDLKRKILKYTIYSLIGVIGYQTISEPEDAKQQKKELPTKIGSGSKYVRIRNYDDKLIDHLKYEEGSIVNKGEPNLVAYDIGDGAKTIGYGHAVFSNPKRGDTGGNYDFLPKYGKIIPGKTRITKKQAETLLKDDIKETTNQLNKILDDWEEQGIKPNITQNMYNAMVSMIFNMGIGNFRTSDFIQYVKRGEMDKAQEQIKNESSHMFDKYPGLKPRRERESEMFGQNINIKESIIKILKEETEKQSKIKNWIEKEGIVKMSMSLGGIKNISKILNETPEVLLTKYISKETFSTDDIEEVGGYDFKFSLYHIGKVGRFHQFSYLIEEGIVNLMLYDESLWDLLGNDVRELDIWWEIQYEIKDILFKFTKDLIDKINLDYESIGLEITFKRNRNK
jgi:lysozyme